MSPLGTLPAGPETDTEITLGTGKMLALFFGLVILCAVFFGMGFTMGKNSVRTAPELLPSPSTTVRAAARPTTSTSTPAQQPQTSEQPQAGTPAASDNSSPATSTNTPAASQDQPPAIPQAGQAFYVQVAAVSKQEDADALVEALKGRQYSAFISSAAADKLLHVQVGPFADIKQAEDMRTKLVADGYSPILKK